MNTVYPVLIGVTWVVTALLLLGIYKLRTKKKISTSVAYVLTFVIFSIRGTIILGLVVMFVKPLV